MDALRAFEGDDIQISFSGTMRPFVLRPKDRPIQMKFYN